MCCEQIEQKLGRYIDNELPVADFGRVEEHLQVCPRCRAEIAQLRELVRGIARADNSCVPESLWASIERRLDTSRQPATGSRAAFVGRLRFRGAPWAIAAGILLVVGLGMFGRRSFESTAQAETVDFGVLLDALPLDAQKAFRKFLVRYDAKPTNPVAAKRLAADLSFDTPQELPGGFKLQSVYELRIGGETGIAAAYDRHGEFLAAVFHPPMKHERFGPHEDYPCVIGEHCGHKVQVGEWKLVHLTDRTTCHCLLSRLDEQTEMAAVMAAIAPTLGETGEEDTHHHH